MSEPVTVEFALTNKEVAHGFRSASFRSPRFVAVLALFALAAVASILGDISGLAFVFGFGAVVGLAYVVWVIPRRLVTRNPAMTAHQKVTFSDAGFDQEASVGSAQLTWAAFRGISETDDFLLLRQGVNIVIILPKRVFDDEQLLRVHAILQAAGLRNAPAGLKTDRQ